MIKINKQWKFVEKFPTISAYSTIFNGLSGKYPFEEAIRSFLWADEVVVVDGGSVDGTREKLEEMSKKYSNLKIYDIPLSDEPSKDGILKAMSRAMTSSEFLIQFDSDELCGGTPDLWKRLCKDMDEGVSLYNLLVVEPYGSPLEIRVNESHTPWKWRVSRNKPEITHGIPKHDRLEKDGKLFSKGFSDGTFPIHIVTNEMYPSYTPSCIQKLLSLKKEEKWDEYKQQMESIIETRPHVVHLGHVHLKTKLTHYLKVWHFWWCDLYGKDPQSPDSNQYFPGVKVEDVTEEMIDQKVIDLIKETPRIILS